MIMKWFEKYEQDAIKSLVERLNRKRLLIETINKRIRNGETQTSLAIVLWIDPYRLSKLRHKMEYSISDTKVKRLFNKI
jgi:hypothetical protein